MSRSRASGTSALFAASLALFLAACGETTSPSRLAPDGAALAAKGGPNASNGANTLKVNIGGLPSGTSASVSVAGPNGYLKTLTASTSLTGLSNGSYTVSAQPVVVGSDTYAGSPSSQSVNLKNGRTVTASVNYAVAPTTGTLIVSVSIGEAVPVAVTVTGPNAYTRAVTRTDTLRSLPAGAYTIDAQPVTGTTGVNYTPAPTTQSATVQIGATTVGSVNYTPTSIGGSGLNLQVVGMYIVQSVQTLSNTVPLLAGRSGVLRVFALANGTNAVQPAVRARFYINGTLQSTVTVPAAAASVPTAVNEASATDSWNVPVSGTLMQPGLSVSVDVDPTNIVEESNETDNQFPLNGSVLAMNVQNLPGLAVRFVPVTQSGATGNVTAANVETFLQRMRDLHPVNTIVATVRSTYTSSYTLVSDGTNWSALLSEINSLRALDGSNDHYYGVAHTAYTSGVAGIGYIGLPASLGWDWSGSAGEVMAHEFGHNWGRQHAPCGGVASPDPSFPYAGGIDGVYGWNVRTNSLIQRTVDDLMGYCSPTWISDYNYVNIFNYRKNSTAGTITSASVQPGLLVWGRVADDGTITLEPAVRVNGRTVLPAQPGSFTAEGTDASGAKIFSVSFEPADVSEDDPNGEQHFAFVIPMSDVDHGKLQTLSVTGFGRNATRNAKLSAALLTAVASDASVEGSNGKIHLHWKNADAPLVLVKDPSTGDVLSFARGGDIDLPSNASALDLVFTDGVHSTTRHATVKK
jgi:CARDB protein